MTDLKLFNVKLKSLSKTNGGYKLNRLRATKLGEKIIITGNVQDITTGVWQRGEVWNADGKFMGDMYWTELNSKMETNTGQFDITITL